MRENSRRRDMTVFPQRAAPNAKAAHILVVDDDQRIRTLLSRYLMKEGYFVSAAADTREASVRMRDIAFDLIVLDVMMPGESGTAFAARLRKSAEPLRSAPILMLTALTETADRVEGLEAGVDDYLAKPFDPRELSLRIASILRRARRAESRGTKALWRFRLRSVARRIAARRRAGPPHDARARSVAGAGRKRRRHCLAPNFGAT